MFFKSLQHSVIRIFTVLLFLCVALKIYSQNGVAINTTGVAANSSAMLDVSSTSAGVLIPRMTSVQRTAISSPATGLLIYQTDEPTGFYYYNGSTWTLLASSANISNITLGQSATTVYGTGSISVTPTSAPTLITGLSASVTVPATGTYYVYITTDGGVANTSGMSSDYCSSDIAVEIDGSIPTDGLQQRITALNNAGLGGNLNYWSMSGIQPLSAGTHTIAVYAAGSGGAGSTATVGGNSSSVLQPELTVILIKQ